MDRTLLVRLETYNPWLGDPTAWPAAAITNRLPERYVPRRRDIQLDERRVTLVVGPRQAGKSTSIWQRLVELERPPLLVDLDDGLLRRVCSSGAALLEAIRDLESAPSALLFDEVQRLDEAGLFLKSLVDLRPGMPIAATGSSSYHLRAATRESLAGRARRTLLLPFSLDEVARAAMAGQPAHRRALVRGDSLGQMARFGAYPDVWLARDDRQREGLLLDLVESFLVREASDLHDIRRPEAFRRLLQLAASQVSNLINQAEYAAVCGISSPTVGDYLEILEESHIIRRLRPFLGGRRAEITSAQKLYFLDTGLRNQLFGGFAPLGERGDRGAVLENHVFAELCKWCEPLDDLRFWRSRNGAEVDFVLRRGDVLVAIEVKAAALARPTVPRALRSFVEAYRPAAAVIFNQGLVEERSLGETRLLFRRVEELTGVLADVLG